MPAEIEMQVGKVLRPPCGRMILCRLVYENKWNAEREQWERRLLRLEEIESCPFPVSGCRKREWFR